ncbi:hypothetical protein N7520_010249 [Penicillium odoratum]|uniref:uncharacterized protein n=1 Tax=Penicillium odoratum TaxID=1167516 RepID=UPI0025497C62|nr:uncharacterized protein N7520_010249 [Penicillium odoratum]KAJ5745067.1 hypothetical protein N7520_010249 [Penicillium odoratum]
MGSEGIRPNVAPAVSAAAAATAFSTVAGVTIASFQKWSGRHFDDDENDDNNDFVIVIVADLMPVSR